MTTIKVRSVNVSEKKGTIKKPVPSICLHQTGIENDAHAGTWHRQVSLLGIESFAKMESAAGRKLVFGEFAENITTEGYILSRMRPLDRLTAGEVILEVTQIGKKCHGQRCAIFRETGDCVMPKEGIFCRVIQGGRLQAGDELRYAQKVIRVRIITLSDRASRGEYKDESGPLLEKLTGTFFESGGRKTEIQCSIIPDEFSELTQLLEQFRKEKVEVVFTTGGTGIGPRDITPGVVKPLLTKEIPGIMELIRVKYGMHFPNALISRGLAGVMDESLVYTLPGSPKAVSEYAGEIFPTLEHSFRMLHQIDMHG
jgi:molybdenum cofactor synthesis domain-containing protein